MHLHALLQVLVEQASEWPGSLPRPKISCSPGTGAVASEPSVRRAGREGQRKGTAWACPLAASNLCHAGVSDKGKFDARKFHLGWSAGVPGSEVLCLGFPGLHPRRSPVLLPRACLNKHGFRAPPAPNCAVGAFWVVVRVFGGQPDAFLPMLRFRGMAELATQLRGAGDHAKVPVMWAFVF